MRYRERLWPGPWAWAGAVALPTVLAIAYGAAYGIIVGIVVWVPTLALTLIGVIATAPTIEVDADSLRAGRARIPRRVLTRGTPLDPQQTSQALRRAPADLFTLVRMWTTKRSVLLEVSDPSDPHSAWLISSRNPEAVLVALDLQDPVVR